MKSKILISLLLLGSCASSVALAFDANANRYANPAANQAQSQNRNQNNQIQEDGPILGWLVVLNKNEIAAANEAMRRNINPMVKKYAQKIEKDHSQNLHQALKTSSKIGESPVPTDEAIALQNQGRQQLAALRNLDDAAFQRAYIQAMIKDHSAALQRIDRDYLKDAQNPRLIKLLKETRAHVAQHLAKARMIQAHLPS